jgi:hypothetical protein
MYFNFSDWFASAMVCLVLPFTNARSRGHARWASLPSLTVENRSGMRRSPHHAAMVPNIVSREVHIA